ncbi:MauE/DoxX family redox-associated membrane protein [Paenibacillus elgii]|uniref:MauE/DoxX family redox-associated membrane protein n=1 Tax=Paenibacillus elgii TaxID=189691 RepID=UPI000248C799|nr:MauE/DoxX family redox-associated membrane protein [Paenibacillus elgii]
MLTLVLSLLMTNIFISTAISKIKDFVGFVDTIKYLSLIKNEPIIKIVAVFVIFVEICGGILLLSHAYYGISVLILVSLLAFFTVIIVFHLKKKTKLKCSCGGFLGNEEISYKIPIRNFILILILLISYLFSSHAVYFFEILNDSVAELILIEVLLLYILASYQLIMQVNSILKA